MLLHNNCTNCTRIAHELHITIISQKAQTTNKGLTNGSKEENENEG